MKVLIVEIVMCDRLLVVVTTQKMLNFGATQILNSDLYINNSMVG